MVGSGLVSASRAISSVLWSGESLNRTVFGVVKSEGLRSSKSNNSAETLWPEPYRKHPVMDGRANSGLNSKSNATLFTCRGAVTL